MQEAGVKLHHQNVDLAKIREKSLRTFTNSLTIWAKMAPNMLWLEKNGARTDMKSFFFLEITFVFGQVGGIRSKFFRTPKHLPAPMGSPWCITTYPVHEVNCYTWHHLTFHSIKGRSVLNFFGIFVGLIAWRMLQNVCKFSLQICYIGGYITFSENRNKSPWSPLQPHDVNWLPEWLAPWNLAS